MSGRTGLGKTHLSLSIAKEVMGKRLWRNLRLYA